jgi:hypothetical protein
MVTIIPQPLENANRFLGAMIDAVCSPVKKVERREGKKVRK